MDSNTDGIRHLKWQIVLFYLIFSYIFHGGYGAQKPHMAHLYEFHVKPFYRFTGGRFNYQSRRECIHVYTEQHMFIKKIMDWKKISC